MNLKKIFSGRTNFYTIVAGIGILMLLAAIGLMLCVGVTFGSTGFFVVAVLLLGFAWLEIALQREQKHRKVFIFLQRFILLTGIFILSSFAGVCCLVLWTLQTAYPGTFCSLCYCPGGRDKWGSALENTCPKT